MIGAEQRGGIKDRVIRAGIDIFTRTDPLESRKSIWDRFPELKKIPEDRWPQNVFIIPDGNGRWAQARKLAVEAGHEKGADVIVQAFNDLNELSEYIPFVGAWGFSMDNLKRPPQEVDFLMNLFDKVVKRLEPDLKEKGNKFIHIGSKDIFDNHPHVRETFDRIEQDTSNNNGQVVYVAIGFSGEDQELRIAQRIADHTRIAPHYQITRALIESLRDGEGHIPSADLVIRSSGEQRLSDLGWIAGRQTELYFDKALFPSFGTKNFVKAIVDFSKRERRFGERSEKNK